MTVEQHDMTKHKSGESEESTEKGGGGNKWEDAEDRRTGRRLQTKYPPWELEQQMAAQQRQQLTSFNWGNGCQTCPPGLGPATPDNPITVFSWLPLLFINPNSGQKQTADLIHPESHRCCTQQPRPCTWSTFAHVSTIFVWPHPHYIMWIKMSDSAVLNLVL